MKVLICAAVIATPVISPEALPISVTANAFTTEYASQTISQAQ